MPRRPVSAASVLTRGSTVVDCVHPLQQLTEWLDESAEYNDVNMVGGPHAELRAALLSFLKHLQKDPFETRVATFVTECVSERLKTGGDMQLLRGDAYRTQFDPLLFWLNALVPSLSKLGGDLVNRLLIAFAPIANTYATTTPASAEAPHPLLMHRFVAFVEAVVQDNPRPTDVAARYGTLLRCLTLLRPLVWSPHRELGPQHNEFVCDCGE
eukprot:GHVU01148454.1.p2 GENE.GHVU01148454.1~~GHVU01148454.1.p2  ORF type:complete len:212 (-),score=53.32 GHVU01148454.1:151-786(-)